MIMTAQTFVVQGKNKYADKTENLDYYIFLSYKIISAQIKYYHFTDAILPVNYKNNSLEYIYKT